MKSLITILSQNKKSTQRRLGAFRGSGDDPWVVVRWVIDERTTRRDEDPLLSRSSWNEQGRVGTEDAKHLSFDFSLRQEGYRWDVDQAVLTKNVLDRLPGVLPRTASLDQGNLHRMHKSVHPRGCRAHVTKHVDVVMDRALVAPGYHRPGDALVLEGGELQEVALDALSGTHACVFGETHARISTHGDPPASLFTIKMAVLSISLMFLRYWDEVRTLVLSSICKTRPNLV